MFLIFLPAAEAYEFYYSTHGNEVSWDEPIIPFYLNPDGLPEHDPDLILEALERCMLTWEDAQGNEIMFDFQGYTSIDHADYYDEKNVVYFLDDPDAWNGTTEDEFAHNHLFSEVSYGEALGFDMAFNTLDFDYTLTDDPARVQTDFLNVATHEIGHALGLRHSYYQEATMYAYAEEGEMKKRTLDADDIAGIQYLYPAGMFAEEEVPNGSSCDTTGSYNLTYAFIGLAALCRRSKRPAPVFG